MSDQYLLRSIVGALSKVPLEHLYLETACLPISYIIACRRMIYLKTILSRQDNELIRRVYNAQVSSSTPGDWSKLVATNFDMPGLDMTEQDIIGMKIHSYKDYIK